ncbi:MAG TPA: hypothetical protein VID68_13300 [Solirubrobacteraceae bacterium]
MQFDQSLLNGCVDAVEHAREQVVTEQQRLRRHRSAVVIALVQRALVQRHHRVGHGDEQRVAAERTGLGRYGGLPSLSLGADVARGAKGGTPRTMLPPHHSAMLG